METSGVTYPMTGIYISFLLTIAIRLQERKIILHGI